MPNSVILGLILPHPAEQNLYNIKISSTGIKMYLLGH